jgi:hypothetical protein
VATVVVEDGRTDGELGCEVGFGRIVCDLALAVDNSVEDFFGHESAYGTDSMLAMPYFKLITRARRVGEEGTWGWRKQAEGLTIEEGSVGTHTDLNCCRMSRVSKCVIAKELLPSGRHSQLIPSYSVSWLALSQRKYAPQ